MDKKLVIYKKLDLGQNDELKIEANRELRILLLDHTDLENYKQGYSYRWHGGYAKKYPFKIMVPYSGTWFLAYEKPGSLTDFVPAIRVSTEPSGYSWPPVFVDFVSSFL